MTTAKPGANSITIGGERFLLVGVNTSHLAREAAEDEDARPALEQWRFDRPEPGHHSHDLAALREPRWKPTTVCGREWHEMKRGEGPSLHGYDEAAHAPECRTCLRIVGRSLSSMPPDQRTPLVVALVMDEVRRTGASRVVGVPGDQTEQLRSAIRAGLRRLKLRGSTHYVADTVFVVSDDAWRALAPEDQQVLQNRVLAALSWSATGEDPLSPTSHIDWGSWGVV